MAEMTKGTNMCNIHIKKEMQEKISMLVTD